MAALWLCSALSLPSVLFGCDQSPSFSTKHPKSAPASESGDAAARSEPSPKQASTPASQAAAQNAANGPYRSALGVNLEGTRSYSKQRVFLDAFQQARSWISQDVEGGPWDTKEDLSIDEHGWIARLAPGKAAATLVADGGPEAYPPGKYVVLYEGKGEMSLGLDAKKIAAEPGRIVFQKGERGALLKIIATDPKDPIRNISVVPLENESDHEEKVFYEPFLAQLRAFPFGVLRFMDMGSTNHSEIAKWSERAAPSNFSQGTGRGVALEYMIDLANELDRDAWFCVPHLADDEYVRKMASLIKARLEPGRSVYLEYSNEVWNRQFEQSRYAVEKGTALDLSDDQNMAQLRYYSQRAVEIFAIAKRELGPDFPLVRVLAGQATNPWAGKQILSWKDAARNADAYAIAPYFGGKLGRGETAAKVSGWSKDQVFAALSKELDDTTRRHIDENVELARKFDLRLIAYEGGQHLVGVGKQANNEALEKLFAEVNRDPRMSSLYERYLELWRSAGGAEFALFTWFGESSKWGHWGIFENHAQKSTAKSLGIQSFLAKNQAFTLEAVRSAGGTTAK